MNKKSSQLMDHFLFYFSYLSSKMSETYTCITRTQYVFWFLVLNPLWQSIVVGLCVYVCVCSQRTGARVERWASLKCALSAGGNWCVMNVTGERTGFEFHPLDLMLLCCVMKQYVTDERAHFFFLSPLVCNCLSICHNVGLFGSCVVRNVIVISAG